MLLAFGVKMGEGSSSSGKARSALNGLRDKALTPQVPTI